MSLESDVKVGLLHFPNDCARVPWSLETRRSLRRRAKLETVRLENTAPECEDTTGTRPSDRGWHGDAVAGNYAKTIPNNSEWE